MTNLNKQTQPSDLHAIIKAQDQLIAAQEGMIETLRALLKLQEEKN